MTDAMINDEDLATWLGCQTWSEFAQSLAAYFDKKGFLTEKQRASALSMKSKCDAKAAAKKAAPVNPDFIAVGEAGVYCCDGTWFRVRWNRAKTNLYAEEIIAHNDSVQFSYAPGMVKKLSATQKVTAAQAKEFGMAYGACMFCGRKLETTESVDAGYGPSCAKKYNLPWGTKTLELV